LVVAGPGCHPASGTCVIFCDTPPGLGIRADAAGGNVRRGASTVLTADETGSRRCSRMPRYRSPAR
jgi:hypothetical protein